MTRRTFIAFVTTLIASALGVGISRNASPSPPKKSAAPLMFKGLRGIDRMRLLVETPPHELSPLDEELTARGLTAAALVRAVRSTMEHAEGGPAIDSTASHVLGIRIASRRAGEEAATRRYISVWAELRLFELKRGARGRPPDPILVWDSGVVFLCRDTEIRDAVMESVTSQAMGLRH